MQCCAAGFFICFPFFFASISWLTTIDIQRTCMFPYHAPHIYTYFVCVQAPARNSMVYYWHSNARAHSHTHSYNVSGYTLYNAHTPVLGYFGDQHKHARHGMECVHVFVYCLLADDTRIPHRSIYLIWRLFTFFSFYVRCGLSLSFFLSPSQSLLRSQKQLSTRKFKN